MATQLDSNIKDELKTQFQTREGVYHLLPLPEYTRTNRVSYTNQQSSPQVRVSIVTLPNPASRVNVNVNSSTNNNLNSISNHSSSINYPPNNASHGIGHSTSSSTHQRQHLLVNGGIASTSTNPGSSSNNNNNILNNNGASGDAMALIASNGGGGGDSYGIIVNPLNGQYEGNRTLPSNMNTYPLSATLEARLGMGMPMHMAPIINGAHLECGGGHMSSGVSPIYGGDHICFNFGRDLYIYPFRGVKMGAELVKPIDKKCYKGMNPSCHDFNAFSATPAGAPLLVGFTTGQIQLVSPHPVPRELRKLFNEERLIDKTKVTCLKWLPNSPNLFLASHSSGHLYLYNEDLPCTTAVPNYQPYKMGDGYSILTCKSKMNRNPLYKWVFTTENCCINEFCFSPCGTYLAIVSQDGFLRVFNYELMELLGIARSYFGGFLCVCWSPDGKYIVVGGEDDLVTVWSVLERRVVARGQGHRSWVSVVAFDPYTTSYTSWDGGDFSDDENPMTDYGRFTSAPGGCIAAASTLGGNSSCNDKNSTPMHSRHRPNSTSFRSDASSLTNDKLVISYRLGSVSQDTQICLWDITEDVLRHQPVPLRQRVNSANLNDTNPTGLMNGEMEGDGIKVIRPVAVGNVSNVSSSCNFKSPPHRKSPCKEQTLIIGEIGSGEPNSNSSSGKFSMANCTAIPTATSSSSQQSSHANTPADDVKMSAMNSNCNATLLGSRLNNKCYNTSTSSTSAVTTTATATAAATALGTCNSIKFPNCISATKSESMEGNITGSYVQLDMSSSGYNSKTSNSGSSKSSDSSSGFSALNLLTQRFSSFSFLNSSSKKGNTSSTENNGSSSTGGSIGIGCGSTASHTRQNRKTLNLFKSYNQQNSINCGTIGQQHHHSAKTEANSTNVHHHQHGFGSLKLGKSSTLSQHNTLLGSLGAMSSTATSNTTSSNSTAPFFNTYDPQKLIGTPACPRFDECPILEPLVCKKIAHERLSALIFREDCFLAACQDGFIYTWARPGYEMNIGQHLSPNQAGPPGGTVI